MKTCRGALNGTIAGIIAREAFVAACLEASMPSFSFPGRESRARIRLGQHALLSSRASVTTSPPGRAIFGTVAPVYNDIVMLGQPV